MIADDLGLYRSGADLKSLREMNPEAQAVEQCAGAEHALVPARGGASVGERSGDRSPRDDASGAASTILGTISLYTPTLVSSNLSAPLGRCDRSRRRFFIDPSGHQHDAGTSRSEVVAVAQPNLCTGGAP